MGAWQIAFVVLGLVVGDYVGELEGLIRVSAAAGVLATVVTVPTLRPARRWASSSPVLAALMTVAGGAGTYYLLPRTFIIATL